MKYLCFLLIFLIFTNCVKYNSLNRFSNYTYFSVGQKKENGRCDLYPDYRKNITNANWLYDNKIENSKYCRNYQVFICNQMTVCKDDPECQYEAARYYLAYRTKEELIKSKEHVFQKDLLERIDKSIKNWKPYSEFITEELNKRKEYCELEREICDNSKKKDKKCLKRAAEIFDNKHQQKK